MELEENSRVSLYRFKRLPFGLSCSPAIFSRQIAQVLAPLIKQGWVKNYLDDSYFWAKVRDLGVMLRPALPHPLGKKALRLISVRINSVKDK